MAAVVTVHFRMRGMWLARLASLTGSERLFSWAVGRVRIEYRAGRGWRDTGSRPRYVPSEGRVV